MYKVIQEILDIRIVIKVMFYGSETVFNIIKFNQM